VTYRKASPEEIMEDLMGRYSLASLLEFQQKIGQAVCAEVVRELRYKHDHFRRGDDFADGFAAAIDYLDPDESAWEGPLPSGIVK
jgi:hypothetical protein